MSKTVDLELKKAFAELHQKTVETTKKVQIADMQIESLKKSKQLAELTTVEIKDNKSFLEKSMKETEEHCRELVKQRKFQPEK
ncbi:unnamed protein product [Nesidiocoris tenuis]|uniref:Uncharacterized protein n=1 Tax=Nesidiocoris tenuis TaxID=355587 RepID=A0A6H5HJC1_9HEMI|nr:unnamed protein product [Nesidiocoris tenuis]